MFCIPIRIFPSISPGPGALKYNRCFSIHLSNIEFNKPGYIFSFFVHLCKYTIKLADHFREFYQIWNKVDPAIYFETLAKALINKKTGDKIILKRDRADIVFEIMDISWRWSRVNWKRTWTTARQFSFVSTRYSIIATPVDRSLPSRPWTWTDYHWAWWPCRSR